MENPDPGFVSRFDSPETVLAREKMVRIQIAERGIRDPNLISALLKIPRHIFLPEEFRAHSYEDKAVPIGKDQTISQPYIVAYIVSQLEIGPSDRILEIGTGSGYLTAVLDLMGAKIVSSEILSDLHKKAILTLENWSPGFTKRNQVLSGDALLLSDTKDRFTKLVSSACFPRIPGEDSFVFESLQELGRAVIPVEFEKGLQFLLTLKKEKGRFLEIHRLPVKFVPLLGRTDLA